MANGSKSILIYSDVHIGSKYSVCSEHPEREDDGDYKPNPNQKKLLEGWYDCIDQIQQKPRALVLNGEPIDGDNKRTLGDSVWSTNLNDQMRDAKKLIKEIKFDNLYFVKGSGYHITKDATNFEQTLAEQLGARKYKSIMGNQTYTDYEVTLEMFDKYIHFTHHTGFSGWWMYRTTPIARELVKMHFAHRENGFHTDVLVRSHVHYYVEVRFPHTKGFTTPAWKFPDGFFYRKGEPELPTIGNVEIIVESNGKIEIDPHLVEVDFKKPVEHL
jgi:hypothetical protein